MAATTVEDLLKSANDASGQARNTWMTFILFGTYLAVTVGATTSKQLLLGAPIDLPLLGVKLPLKAFFQLVPGLFVFVHFYTLVQLYLLSRTLHFLNQAIDASHIAADKARLRARIDSFVVTQLISGAQRDLLPQMFVRLAAWVTLLAAPVALLLAFQLQFLAYHDGQTTWIHRIALAADLFLVWLLWPAIVHDSGRFGGALTGWVGALLSRFWPAMKQLVAETQQIATHGLQPSVTALLAHMRTVLGARNAITDPLRQLAGLTALIVVSAGALVFSFLIATIPGEAIEIWLVGRMTTLSADEFEKDCASADALGCLRHPALWSTRYPSRELGDGYLAWTPTFVIFNESPRLARNIRLSDPNLIADYAERLDKVDQTVVLRGRDLRGAHFENVDLRKADLSDAQLQAAVLLQANLQGVTLHGANLHGANLIGARLQHANLRGVVFEGLNLVGAEFQGANLAGGNLAGARLGEADFEGADLDGADLNGADLATANLRGARLEQANLDNAYLGFARLQGANLAKASLRGTDLGAADLRDADLGEASLEGANLAWAKLGGAKLEWATLRAADLRRAALQGADLSQAGLQGANLSGADLQGGFLDGTGLQGADVTGADLRGAYLGDSNLQGADFSGARLQGSNLAFASAWRTKAVGAMLDLADGGATISLTPNGEDVRSEISGWLGSIASEKMRQAAQGRFGVLIAEITAESEATLAQPWLKATRTPWDATRDDPGLADALRSLGCVAIEAPHVARGLLRRIDLEDRARPYVPRLAAHLLSPDCKGAKGLTDEERSRLQDLAGQGVDPPGRQQK